MLPPIKSEKGALVELVPDGFKKCLHEKLTRINPNEVMCKACKAGWRFTQIPDEFLARVDKSE